MVLLDELEWSFRIRRYEQLKEAFADEVAEAMVSEMTASMDFISRMATFADEEERESVMKVYRQAIQSMQERITRREQE